MTTIRKIVTSQVDGNSANANEIGEIRPFGEAGFYIDTNGPDDKLVLSMFDGQRTHLKSKVLSPGVLYGSNADSGDGAGLDTIKLIPDAQQHFNDSNYGNDQYLIIDPTAPNHIHIRAGGTIDSSNADLFLGGEQNHVKISDGSDTVTVRTSQEGEGVVNRDWVFDNNGVLTFPNSALVDSADSNIEFRGMSNFNVEAGGAFNIVTDAQDAAHSWQFGDDGNLSLPSGFIRSTQVTGLNLASNYDVHIVADYTDNNYEWIFEGGTAELTVPGAIKSKTNPPTGTQVTNLPYTLGAGAANGYVGLGVEWNAVVALGDLTGYTLTAQQTGSTIFTTTITQMRDNLGGQPAFQTADGLPSYSADITFTLTSPDYAPQTVNNLELAAGNNTWSFRSDGILIAPSTIAFGDGNRTNINQVNNNFVITTNTGPGDPYSWTFDEFGNLTLPGGAIIDTYDLGAENATYFWGATNKLLAIRAKESDGSPAGGIHVNANGSVEILAQTSQPSVESVTFTFNPSGGLTFPDTTVQTTAYPGITNTHQNTATLVVGQNVATRGNLSIRLTNNNNTLDVEVNYQNPSNTVSVSAYRAYPSNVNLYAGRANKLANNTTWDNFGNLPGAGDSLSFTFTDHSFFNIYRVTLIADIMPGVGAAGEAFCTIEELK